MQKNERRSSLNLSSVRAERLLDNKNKIRRLAIACAIMFSWLLIWALVFKLGSETLLIRNYTNLKDMTFKERILWDLIPFNYRGDEYWKSRQILDTVLNCFVFAPLAIFLCYIFEKKNVFRDAAICFGFAVIVETTQLFTVLGNPATEDLITNTLGCFIGYTIYCLILKRISLRKSAILLTLVCAMISVATAFSLVTTAMSADVIFKIITRTL